MWHAIKTRLHLSERRCVVTIVVRTGLDFLLAVKVVTWWMNSLPNSGADLGDVDVGVVKIRRGLVEPLDH